MSQIKNEKVIKIITNPFLISFIIAVVIIINLPSVFEKYKIEITKHNKIDLNLTNYYYDLNYDGFSEKIEII